MISFCWIICRLITGYCPTGACPQRSAGASRIEAGTSAELSLSKVLEQATIGVSPYAELWLEVSLSLVADCRWAERGHEVAWSQLLRGNRQARIRVNGALRRGLQISEEKHSLQVGNGSFQLSLSALRSGFQGLSLHGKESCLAVPR